MTDLASFLLQQITDDETTAKAATTLGHGWDADGLAGDVYASGDDPQTGTVVAECGDHEDAEHIARWSPERVLAECEAKRRIVDEHRGEAEDVSWSETAVYCRRCCYDGGLDRDVYPCPTLLALALPYSQHPDYRQEWKP